MGVHPTVHSTQEGYEDSDNVNIIVIDILYLI